MGAPYYYYENPFGVNADDLTAIPTNAAVDGSVSYFAGWTPPYEFDLNTDPSAKPIPRGQMNQFMYDVTNNLQEYQQYGTPQWITAISFAYPIYARVYYLGDLYENQVASNTATPGTDDTWLKISANAQGVPTGTIIDFAGTVAPTGYLICDGTAYSRTTYSNLLGKISFIQNGTTINTMNTVTGLSSTANMYIGMPLEGTNIPSGTTVASITTSTSITMSQTATGSATVPIQFFSWGNGNGSTTFNMPDLRRRVSMGAGGTPSTFIPPGIGAIVGQIGGEESHVQTLAELVSHSHNLNVKTGIGSGNAIDTSNEIAVPSSLYIGATGGGAAFNIIQTSAIMNKCIKT